MDISLREQAVHQSQPPPLSRRWRRAREPISKIRTKRKTKGATAYAKLAVVLNSVLVIFLDVVGKIINGDIVVINVLHDLRSDTVK